MHHLIRQHKSRWREKGQAMTEFLIAASFFLVPLFLAMSLIAKYIDIKQANVQAARYQAWEYTVWYANDTERDYFGNDGEIMSGFTAADQPIKAASETRNESKQRFYRNPGNENTTFPILDADQTAPWDAAEANPLWRNHRGQPLYAAADGDVATLASSEDTPTIPVVGGIMNLLLDGIGVAFNIIGKILGAIQSPVGFNAINTNGYAVANESMEISANRTFNRMAGLPATRAYRLDGTDNIKINGNSVANSFSIATTASVLTDGWSAGGGDQVYRQAGGTVPTTVLNAILEKIPGFNAMWSIASALAPELMPCDPLYTHPFDNNPNGSLWLGYIDTDAVHPDRLLADISDPGTTNGTHSCNDAGMCDLEPVVPRPAVEDRECKRF
jgi:hypothetical protein